MHYLHDMDVCLECRVSRKTTWTTNEIVVRTQGSVVNGPTTKAKGNAVNGTRQSRRLQKMKDCKVSVTKTTTVKDIKVQVCALLFDLDRWGAHFVKVQEELKIPTIQQTLLLRGRELSDSSECVGPELYLGEILELREDKVIVDVDSDEEEKPPRGNEGAAFGGTLLGSGM